MDYLARCLAGIPDKIKRSPSLQPNAFLGRVSAINTTTSLAIKTAPRNGFSMDCVGRKPGHRWRSFCGDVPSLDMHTRFISRAGHEHVCGYIPRSMQQSRQWGAARVRTLPYNLYVPDRYICGGGATSVFRGEACPDDQSADNEASPTTAVPAPTCLRSGGGGSGVGGCPLLSGPRRYRWGFYRRFYKRTITAYGVKEPKEKRDLLEPEIMKTIGS